METIYQLAERSASIIFSTNDAGSKTIYRLFSKNPTAQKIILTEYIYLKTYIVDYLNKKAAPNTEDYDILTREILSHLKDTFATKVNLACDKCLYEVQVQRLNSYKSDVKQYGEDILLISFLNRIGRSTMTECGVSEENIVALLADSYEDIRNRLANNSKGGYLNTTMKVVAILFISVLAKKISMSAYYFAFGILIIAFWGTWLSGDNAQTKKYGMFFNIIGCLAIISGIGYLMK